MIFVPEQYPSNSFVKNSLGQGPQKQEVSNSELPKIEGKASLKKKSLGQKFVDTFLVDDISTTVNHIWASVLVPKMKDIFSSMVDTALYGAPRSSSVARTGTTSQTPYSSISTGKQENKGVQGLARQPMDDIYLYNEEDVMNLFNALRDLIHEKGYATVGDALRILRLPSDYTKEAYGWRSLPEITYTRGFDGDGNQVYCPILPRPIWLK